GGRGGVGGGGGGGREEGGGAGEGGLGGEGEGGSSAVEGAGGLDRGDGGLDPQLARGPGGGSRRAARARRQPVDRRGLEPASPIARQAVAREESTADVRVEAGGLHAEDAGGPARGGQAALPRH